MSLTGTTPRSDGAPPAWSSCMCVSSTSSSRLMPCLPSARLRPAPGGPVSTRAACVPSLTRIASPCPTSRTTSSARPGRTGPMTTRTMTPPAAAVTHRARTRSDRGHQTQRTASATAHAAHAAPDGVGERPDRDGAGSAGRNRRRRRDRRPRRRGPARELSSRPGPQAPLARGPGAPGRLRIGLEHPPRKPTASHSRCRFGLRTLFGTRPARTTRCD